MTARRAAYAVLTTAHYVVSAATTRLDRLADRLQAHALFLAWRSRTASHAPRM